MSELPSKIKKLADQMLYHYAAWVGAQVALHSAGYSSELLINRDERKVGCKMFGAQGRELEFMQRKIPDRGGTHE